jgi:hypothetical protein
MGIYYGSKLAKGLCYDLQGLTMGSLKPGATYIYEHADGVTYAREFGAAHSERFEIGRTFIKQQKDYVEQQRQFWTAVVEAAAENKVLQDAIDRVKILYELSKDNGQK